MKKHLSVFFSLFGMICFSASAQAATFNLQFRYPDQQTLFADNGTVKDGDMNLVWNGYYVTSITSSQFIFDQVGGSTTWPSGVAFCGPVFTLTSPGIIQSVTLDGSTTINTNQSGLKISYTNNKIYLNWEGVSVNHGQKIVYNYTVSSVPEPSTYGLIGLAALGLAFAARRRKLKTA